MTVNDVVVVNHTQATALSSVDGLYRCMDVSMWRQVACHVYDDALDPNGSHPCLRDAAAAFTCNENSCCVTQMQHL